LGPLDAPGDALGEFRSGSRRRGGQLPPRQAQRSGLNQSLWADRPVIDIDDFVTLSKAPAPINCRSDGSGLRCVPRPEAHHGKVYRLSELAEVIEGNGMPTDDRPSNYAGYARGSFEKYVEIQLCVDDPVYGIKASD
jgi:hypothetical protein